MYEINKLLSDFTAAANGVDFSSLHDEIWVNESITTLFYGTRTENDHSVVYFVFESQPQAGEITALDTIIASHTGKAAEPTELARAIRAAKDSIDEAAGEARARYITVAPGQGAVYIAKEEDAKKHKDAAYPSDLTNYKFIQAETNAQGVSAQVATDTILATAESWKTLAANIEELRLSYKNQVSAAQDVQTVKALDHKARALLNAI